MSQYKPTSSKFQEVVLHFIFTPKYRSAVLTGDVATRLDEIVRALCDELSAEILAFAIKPEHIHLLVAMPRDLTTSSFVHRVKGRTSRFLRQEFPHLVTNCPKALWGRDFFVRSVGGRRAVRKYINDHNLD